MLKGDNDEQSVQSVDSVTNAADVRRREERNRLISSLELDHPNNKVEIPEDIFDFDVWTDDDIVDFFDSGLIRPPPANVGTCLLWPDIKI